MWYSVTVCIRKNRGAYPPRATIEQIRTEALSEEYLYEKYFYQLLNLRSLLQIPSLYTPLTHSAEIVYPKHLLEIDRSSPDRVLIAAFELLTFLKARARNIVALGSGDFDTYSQRLALRHFIEKKYFLRQNPEDLTSTFFWNELLSYGLLWKLYKAGVITLGSYPPGTTITQQGANDGSVIFNLTPIEVFYDGVKINTIVNNSILGEGAMLGLPRGTELRTPDIARVEHFAATMDCELLKKKMPSFFEALRLEIFISFLEKLQNSNERAVHAVERLRQQNIAYDTILKTTPQARAISYTLDNLHETDLFQGILIPGKENKVKQYLQKIIRVEKYEPGEIIIPIDTQPSKICILHSGQVSIQNRAGLVFAYAEAGQVIGESVISGTPTIAQVMAETPTVLTTITRQDIMESALKKLFFLNCFKILQRKLTTINQINTQLELLLRNNNIKESEREKALKDGSGQSLPRNSAYLAPYYERKERKSVPMALKAKKSEPMRPVPPGPLRRLTQLVGASLKNWLGENVDEKDSRELRETMERYQARLQQEKKK
jgi:CRP-like cAMP-binding protein